MTKHIPMLPFIRGTVVRRSSSPQRSSHELYRLGAYERNFVITPLTHRFRHCPSRNPHADMSLPPLPPGWTRERVLATPPVEMAALPDDEFTAISAFLDAESDASLAAVRAAGSAHHAAANASRVAAGMPTIEDEDAAAASAVGIPPGDPAGQADLLRINKTMQDIGAECWGFVVAKTWGYKPSERDRWVAFWRRWEELSDAKLRSMGAVGDLRSGFPGKLQWYLIQDEERLDGKGVEEVREMFAELVGEEGRIPNGLDLDLCLVVDAAAAASFLDGDTNDPFVVGVDIDGDDEAEDGYLGYFKIAADVLIPELWETLQRQAPYELDPGSEEIYRGIMG